MLLIWQLSSSCSLGRPARSVSRDARSHWHNSPEKLAAWAVKHGAFIRRHAERLFAFSYPNSTGAFISLLQPRQQNTHVRLWVYRQRKKESAMYGFTQIYHISLWCLKDPMSVSASSHDYASCSCWMANRTTEQIANNGTHTNNNEHRSSAFSLLWLPCQSQKTPQYFVMFAPVFCCNSAIVVRVCSVAAVLRLSCIRPRAMMLFSLFLVYLVCSGECTTSTFPETADHI